MEYGGGTKQVEEEASKGLDRDTTGYKAVRKFSLGVNSGSCSKNVVQLL